MFNLDQCRELICEPIRGSLSRAMGQVLLMLEEVLIVAKERGIVGLVGGGGGV